MDPILLIAAIRAAISLGTDLAPTFEAMVSKGQITVEQQAAALAAYEELKARDHGEFTGPEWQVATASPITTADTQAQVPSAV